MKADEILKKETEEGKIVDEQDIKNTIRLKRLVNILQHPSDTIQEFLDFALKQAILMTRSQIGYIYHYNEASQEFVLNTWSEEVMEECRVEKIQTTYALEKTGLWGEAVRQRCPIVINDFSAENPLKKGYPRGHVELKKFLTVPVFKDNLIVGVVGLGNKETDYSESDILEVTFLMESVWIVSERKKSEAALLESKARYDELVRRLPVGIYTMRIRKGGKFQFEYCSEMFCTMLGVNEKQVLEDAESVFQTIVQDDRFSLDEANKKAAQNLESFRWEGRRLRHGKIRWIRVESEPTILSNGDSLWNGVIFDISEQKEAEAQLRESEERFKSLHNASFGGIAIHDKGVILECNQGLSEMTQYAIDELIGMDGLMLIAPDDREFVREKIVSGYENSYEAHGLRKNGEIFPMQLEAKNIPFKGKRVRVVEFRDITELERSYTRILETNKQLQNEIKERRLTEEALRASEEKLQTIIETSPDGIVISTLDGVLEFVTAKGISMWGYDSVDEVIGKNVMDFVHPTYQEKAIYFITEMLNGNLTGAAEYLMVKKDGSCFYCEVNANILRDINKNPIGILYIERDITERKRMEEELKELAIKDQLTGLYNRRKIDEVLVNEKYQADRSSQNLSIIIADIDMFKLVNDQFGHLIGDSVLSEVTKVLSNGIRRTDVLGRWGGEEFMIICPETDLEGAVILAEKLRKKIEEFEFRIVGHKTCSFGVAQLRKDESIDALLFRSDMALYRAKERGRNRVEAEILQVKE